MLVGCTLNSTALTAHWLWERMEFKQENGNLKSPEANQERTKIVMVGWMSLFSLLLSVVFEGIFVWFLIDSYHLTTKSLISDLKPTLQASSLSSKLGLPTSPDLKNNNTLHHQTSYPSTFFSDLKLGLSSSTTSPKSSQSSETHRVGHPLQHSISSKLGLPTSPDLKNNNNTHHQSNVGVGGGQNQSNGEYYGIWFGWRGMHLLCSF